MNYTVKSPSGEGTLALSTAPLGKGGEGSVYAVTSHSLPSLGDANNLVAKIYHNPQEGDRERKVQAMVDAPPASDSLAWPLALVYQNGSFAGYIMVKLDVSKYKTWHELANASRRKKVLPDFSVQYALVAINNLAIALTSIHRSGHCLGDVNESNILVGAQADIMIVDTDSAQIRAHDGTIYPCLVGKPEYTASEITHGRFEDNPRTVATDMFAYAVASYQMLTGGSVPTKATFKGAGDPPSVTESVRQEIMPGIFPVDSWYGVPPMVPQSAIPSVFMAIYRRALSADPSRRPGLSQVIEAQSKVIANLAQCKKNPNHYWDQREGNKCKWCAFVETGGPDIWGDTKPVPSAQQTKLPGLTFQEVNNQPVIRRAPAGTSGTSGTNASNGSNMQASGNNLPPVAPSGNTVPSGNSGSSVPPGGNNGSTSNQIPAKIKGKTVLVYADGTYGPRPPLSELFKSGQGKLAVKCFLDEQPKYMKFTWDKTRMVPKIPALLVGLILGLLVSASWLITVPWALFQINWDNQLWSKSIEHSPVFALVGVATGALACFLHLMNGLLVRRRTAKALPQGGSMIEEKPGATIFGFLGVAVFWGPLFVVIGFIFALSMALEPAMNNLSKQVGSK